MAIPIININPTINAPPNESVAIKATVAVPDDMVTVVAPLKSVKVETSVVVSVVA